MDISFNQARISLDTDGRIESSAQGVTSIAAYKVWTDKEDVNHWDEYYRTIKIRTQTGVIELRLQAWKPESLAIESAA